jgi:hypothetical protein
MPTTGLPSRTPHRRTQPAASDIFNMVEIHVRVKLYLWNDACHHIDGVIAVGLDDMSAEFV